jgi:hypothetical protein
MNKLKKILSFILVACFGFSVNAQNATATANIDATATIITPISVAGTALAFGNFATSGVGTVVLATNSDLSSTLLAKNMQATGTAGTITVTGEDSELFSLAISQLGDFKIVGAFGDANTLGLSDFTSSLGTPNPTTSINGGKQVFDNITIPGGVGSVTINIGATLTTTVTQNAGDYVGEITVLVSYE